MDRRNSSDGPQRPTNPNIFDDEYAVDPEDADFIPVADGFRPDTAPPQTRDEPTPGHTKDHSPPPAVPGTNGSESNSRWIGSRNSTAKPPAPRDSTSKDGQIAGGQARGSGSQTTPLQHRVSVSSTNSFVTIAQSESPLGNGPSHPYGMYPQTTVARSSSVTTSSTSRPPRRSFSAQPPTHPYGLYAQNVVESPDEPPITPTPAAIPVGFPGLGAGFHRRIGPDGEEQDIIGPDGHTEQLPPYSRFPEEGPTKAAMAAEANATNVDIPPSPTTPITPPSAEIPPPPTPAPQQEEQANDSASSSSGSDVAERGLSEKKPEKKKVTKRWSDKRLWGCVPLGVVILVLVLIVIFAIILGAAIGTVVVKSKNRNGGRGNRKEQQESQNAGPSRSMFDASPIPTPIPTLPPLPTGQFALPLGVAQESSPNCLRESDQLLAWSCKMSVVPLLLTVNFTITNPARGPMPVAAIEPFTKPDGGIQYGVQPPVLRNNPLQLVLDQDYRAYSPAWHFQKTYDKVVILGSRDFPAGASLRVREPDENGSRSKKRGRDGDTPQKPGFRHRFQVQPGDTPWYCIWNQTFIEAYIYVSNNSTAATFTGPPGPFATTSLGAVPSGPFPQTTGPDGVVQTPPPSTTAGQPVRREPHPAVAFQKRGDLDYPMYSAYPRIVKIEERRLPDSPKPYCQKMRLTTENTIIPELDEQQQEIKIELDEDHPEWYEFFLSPGPSGPSDAGPSAPSSTSPNSGSKRGMVEKRRDPADACHCQWMFQ